jgi:hypothetical protein
MQKQKVLNQKIQETIARAIKGKGDKRDNLRS